MTIMKAKIFLASLLLTALFCSCKSLEKQRTEAIKFYHDHPGELAGECAEKYPPKIEYKAGQPVLVPGDTVRIPGPTLQCPDIPATGNAPAIPGKVLKCPGSKFVTDTMRIKDTAFVENTALVAALQYRLDTTGKALLALQVQHAACEKTARIRMWWIAVLCVTIGVLVFLRVKKII